MILILATLCGHVKFLKTWSQIGIGKLWLLEESYAWAMPTAEILRIKRYLNMLFKQLT